MLKFFDSDSKLMRTLGTMAELMILNVLTILCSIPIVTMGAAVTALYDAVWRLQQEEGKLTQAYFAAFKANFKRATILWLIYLPLGVILVANFYTAFTKDTSLFATIFSLFGMMWWIFAVSWVFPLQSRFENTLWCTFRNSLLVPLCYFPRTLAMAVLNALPWALLIEPVYFSMGGPLWLFLYFALAAHLNLKLLGKPFDHFFAQAAVDEYNEKKQLEE